MPTNVADGADIRRPFLRISLSTIVQFADYYNATDVGNSGALNVPIPDCWLEHLGLVAELATLTPGGSILA